jgi:hypothetical protein
LRPAHRGLVAASVLCFAAAADAQNLVPDPAFRYGVTSWSAAGVAGTFTLTFAPGTSVRLGSGSARLDLQAPATGTYGVCVPVAAGRLYVWGFSMYFPDPSRMSGLTENVEIFDGPGCTGAVIGGRALLIIGVPGIWLSGTYGTLPMPAGAQSVRAGFGGFGTGTNQATAYVDDVFVAPAGTVPPIEPVPEDVRFLSTPGLLALGAALALAAARLLGAAFPSSA